MSNVRPICPQIEENWLADILECIREGKSVRRELPRGGRLHIDRPLPFLCVHIAGDDAEPVARDIAQANAFYLVAPHANEAIPVIEAIEAISRAIWRLPALRHRRTVTG